jgi:hypothetical protein
MMAWLVLALTFVVSNPFIRVIIMASEFSQPQQSTERSWTQGWSISKMENCFLSSLCWKTLPTTVQEENLLGGDHESITSSPLSVAFGANVGTKIENFYQSSLSRE